MVTATPLEWTPRAPQLPAVDGLPPVSEFLKLGMSEEQIAPLIEVHQAYAEARAAIRDLADGRPGGAQWAEAHKRDTELVLNEKEPRHVTALLAGDHKRYARAAALVRAIPTVQRLALDGAFRKLVGSVAVKVLGELTAEWEQVGREGWNARSTPAHDHVVLEELNARLADIRRAILARDWASGAVPRWRDPLTNGYLPPSKPGIGFFYALQRRTGTRWLFIPQNVEWPPGVDLNGSEMTGPGIDKLYTEGHREVPGNSTSSRLNELRA